MKSTQKEQRYQENSNTNFQPAPSSLSEELEATLSQNISTSYSDASRINTQSVEAPTLQKMDEVNYNSRVAEDSETEDNDLYLSDCRIFLVGFGENELAKLVGMIRKGGGSRYMLLSEKLTHIIVGTPSEV